MKVLILICMIFCHIVDDYYLQGILASMKQKQWWEKNASEDLYKNDYKVALLMYSFSWSFMIMTPSVVYKFITGGTDISMIIALFIANVLIHSIVDNLKANRKLINLITDQTIHLVQIVYAWLFVVVINY